METIGIAVLGVIALLAVGAYIWNDNKTTNKGKPSGTNDKGVFKPKNKIK